MPKQQKKRLPELSPLTYSILGYRHLLSVVITGQTKKKHCWIMTGNELFTVSRMVMVPDGWLVSGQTSFCGQEKVDGVVRERETKTGVGGEKPWLPVLATDTPPLSYKSRRSLKQVPNVGSTFYWLHCALVIHARVYTITTNHLNKVQHCYGQVWCKSVH